MSREKHQKKCALPDDICFMAFQSGSHFHVAKWLCTLVHCCCLRLDLHVREGMTEQLRRCQAVESLPLWTLEMALAGLFDSFRHLNYANTNVLKHKLPGCMFWCTVFNHFWQFHKAPPCCEFCLAVPVKLLICSHMSSVGISLTHF